MPYSGGTRATVTGALSCPEPPPWTSGCRAASASDGGMLLKARCHSGGEKINFEIKFNPKPTGLGRRWWHLSTRALPQVTNLGLLNWPGPVVDSQQEPGKSDSDHDEPPIMMSRSRVLAK